MPFSLRARMEDFGLLEKKERIAIFGGTFDPPHFGHIHCILQAKERYALDEVWVIPAHANPLKSTETSAIDRFRMAQLAFENLENCCVLDLEIQRPAPSYTIETLEWLMEHDQKFYDAERFLILGRGVQFDLWKDKERIEQLLQPIMIDEAGNFLVSSTLVREWLQKKISIGHLIPSSVLTYIVEHNLYLEDS